MAEPESPWYTEKSLFPVLSTPGNSNKKTRSPENSNIRQCKMINELFSFCCFRNRLPKVFCCCLIFKEAEKELSQCNAYFLGHFYYFY